MHAESLQLCPTLCDPMNHSPPGSSVHRDSPGGNTRAGCHVILWGIFPTQGSKPAYFTSPALAGGFFTTWEAPFFYVCLCLNFLVRKIIRTPARLGFPGGSDGNESICNARDLFSIPEWERCPGEKNGNPLQYSCLENPRDQGI